MKFCFRQLNANLAGVIFGCTNETYDECVEGKIFGLPKNHLTYVQNIKPEMTIFLFNYTTRELHGVFKAISKGRLDINPYGWTSGRYEKTSFPAQVQVELFKAGTPLKEHQFKPAIRENYTNYNFFMFELDHSQVTHLCELFKSAIPSRLSTSTSSFQTGRSTAESSVKKSVKKSRTPVRNTRSQLEEDGLICSPLRPRTVAEANGLIMNIAKPRSAKEVPKLTSNTANVQRPVHVPGFSDVDVESKIAHKFREVMTAAEGSSVTNVVQDFSDDKAKSEVASVGGEISEDNVKLEVQDDITELSNEKTQPTSSMETAENIKDTFRPKLVSEVDGSFDTVVESSKVEDIKGSVEITSRPRLVGEANGLFDDSSKIKSTQKEEEEEESIGKESLRTSPVYGFADLGDHENCPSVDILRKLLEGLDAKSEAMVLDSSEEILCLFGGIDQEQYFHRMEYLLEEGWMEGPYLPVSNFLNAQAVALNRYIYLLGGNTESAVNPSDSVEVLKEGAIAWTSVCSMPQARSFFSVSSLYEKLIVVGGQSEDQELTSCEIYDPQRDVWISGPPLRMERSCLGLSVDADKSIVYASGGCQEGCCTSTIEQLDPRMGRWTELPRMVERRQHHGAVVFEGKLWMLGGESNQGSYLSTVEEYDPRNQSWQKKTPLPQPCAFHTVEVFQDEILLLGGSLDPQKALFRDMVRYSSEEESWEDGYLAGSSGKRSHHASCVLHCSS